MKRILFIFGVALSIYLVSCGRAEQNSSDKLEEESKISSVQEAQGNTGNANQVAVGSSSDYPEYEDAESLVKASDAIFSGTVLNITNEDLCISKGKNAEKFPYLIYEVKIDTLFQGKVTEDVIKIKHFDTGNKEDAPCIEKGISYLFLVEVYDDSYPSLVNANQSYFAMDAKQTEGVTQYSTSKKSEKQQISIENVMAIVSGN